MSQNTRQRQTMIDGVVETLDREKMCVIPPDVLRLLLQDNAMVHEKSNQINETMSKFCETTSENLTKIAVSLEVIADKMGTSNAELITKLDNLVTAVTATNLTTNRSGIPSLDGSKKKLLEERFTLTKKKHRDTRLCEIYTEGINSEVKFVPPKFRTHVSSTASESEKKHRRDATIYNVETQIKIMQDSMKEWTQRIQEIDTEIDVFIGANEHLREPIMEKVQTQEETAKTNVEKIPSQSY